MKKIICIAMILLMIFYTAACGERGDIAVIGGEPGGTVNMTDEVQLSATPLAPGGYCPVGEYESIRSMAMELFKKTAALSEEENLLISPVSIMNALAMAAQGAEAETLAQFEEAFGKDAAFLATLMADYTDTITMHNETAKVNVANSIWIRDDAERLTVKEDFLAKCNNLRAETFKSAFNSGTVRDINKWVDKNTDGMIDSILDEIPEAAVMYLVNALSFDNEWERRYEGYQLRDGTFTAADGKEQKTEFMFSGEDVFLKDSKATGFIKPYKDDFSFVAILPNEGVSVEEYIAGMDENTLTNLIEGGKGTDWVSTGLPKFKITSEENLVPVLESIGMTEMFDEVSADFGAMATSTRGNIFISKVAHKAFIEVDSNGTRAAAATIMEASDGAAMVAEEVILDRPFIYMIVDDYPNDSLPLFIGTVETICTE